MILSEIATGTTLTASNPIPLSTPTLSTNSNVTLNSAKNGFIISTPGIYKVRLQINVTAGTGGEIGAELYANGNAIDETLVTVSVASTEFGEIVIEYPVNVVSAAAPSQALVQFYATEPGTVLSGYATVERIS